MFQVMGVDRCFSKPAGEKQARLCSNKTKFRSFHIAVGTLQNSKEHLAPAWTPTRESWWIIHSEVSRNRRLPSTPVCSPSPHPYALYMNQWNFCSMVRHKENTHGHAHAQTHKVKYDPRDPFTVFCCCFCAEKHILSQRFVVPDNVAQNIPG